MSKLISSPEAFFMNELPFPLRETARELFLFCALDDLVLIKKGNVSKALMLRHRLDTDQWSMIASAVILARLPQYRLLNYFDKDLLVHLQTLALDALQMPGFSCEEAAKIIEQDAPTLASWMRHLQKLLSKS